VKILIFSAFDPIPSDASEPIRYAPLANAFADQGHEVLYISSGFLHITKSYRINRHWDKSGTNPARVELKLLHTPSYLKNVSMARIWNHIILALKLRSFLNQLPANKLPALIISASPPLIANYFMVRWGKKRKIPVILDIQDYWPEVFKTQLAYQWFSDILLFPLRKISSFNIKNARAVTSVSQDYLDFYKKNIGDKPATVFHLGIRTQIFPELPEKKEPNDHLKLIYLGTSQNNTIIRKFAAYVRNQKDMSLTMAGMGVLPSGENENVHYEPWIPFNELPVRMLEFDAGLLLTEPGLQIAFPNKAFVYFATGLPVISNLAGAEMQKLISENDLGITIDVASEKAFGEAVEYIKSHFGNIDRKRIHSFAVEHYNILNIAQQFMKWALARL
jgi:hypothetical protein